MSSKPFFLSLQAQLLAKCPWWTLTHVPVSHASYAKDSPIVSTWHLIVVRLYTAFFFFFYLCFCQTYINAFSLNILSICHSCGEPDEQGFGSRYYCWSSHPFPHSQGWWLPIWNPVSHPEATELSLFELPSCEDRVSSCKYFMWHQQHFSWLVLFKLNQITKSVQTVATAPLLHTG